MLFRSDSTLRIEEASAAARDDGQAALAITDLGNLFGAVKFYKACREDGVKPLIGVDLWMQPEGTDKDPSRLLVLVQDMPGYLKLCDVLSQAWTTHVQRAQAWVRWEWIESAPGWIVLCGAEQGAIGAALLAGDEPKAQALAQRLASWFPGRFYIELQRAGLPQHETHVRRAVPLAARLGLPVVATHPVQFLKPDDFEAHEAREIGRAHV